MPAAAEQPDDPVAVGEDRPRHEAIAGAARRALPRRRGARRRRTRGRGARPGAGCRAAAEVGSAGRAVAGAVGAWAWRRRDRSSSRARASLAGLYEPRVQLAPWPAASVGRIPDTGRASRRRKCLCTSRLTGGPGIALSWPGRRSMSSERTTIPIFQPRHDTREFSPSESAAAAGRSHVEARARPPARSACGCSRARSARTARCSARPLQPLPFRIGRAARASSSCCRRTTSRRPTPRSTPTASRCGCATSAAATAPS